MKNLFSIFLILSCISGTYAQITFKSSNTAINSLVVSDNSVYSANNVLVFSSPLSFTTPVSGVGTRLMWLPAKAAFRVGSVNGTQWDASNIGILSIGMGESVTASGPRSVAFGAYTTASGEWSTSMGIGTTASGDYSTSIGNTTTAQAFNSFAIGRYNVITGFSNNWVSTDPLFVIGNGSTSQIRSNAFTVLKNGKVAIGFEAPESMLHIKNGDAGSITYYPNSNLNVESNANNYISLLNPNNIESGILFGNPTNNADGGVIYNNGNTKSLQFRTNGNVTRMTLSSAGNLTVTGTITASCGLLICSDARYKKNIANLDNSLNNLLKITGVRYDLRQSEFPEKNFSEKNQIGFIAQEIEKIFPEMVFTDEKGFKSVDYARITPVLVEAIKELTLKSQKLENRLDKVEAMLSVPSQSNGK